MANDIKNILPANSLTSTQVEQPKAAAGKEIASSTISQDEFLNLLVHQLQNQDPLNPMQNEEFAVQLAQFSQLEQLVQINDKVGQESQASAASSGPSSMASYLGHEVAYPDDLVRVKNGSGSNLLVDIPPGTESLRVDILSGGKVTGSVMFEEFDKTGRQTLPLGPLGLKDGKYEARVVSVGKDGKFVELDAKSTATVEGFVMNPSPKLLVGGEEVAVEDVSAVYL